MSQLPPLEDLRVFVIAATSGGFTAAAEQLSFSPAYVSKRIGLLEKALGVRLFLRSARSVSLTLEGKIALEWSERLLDTMEQMSLEISLEQQVPRGRLRIATSTGFGSHCIAPIISDLVFHYPELEVDLELLDRPVDLVSEGFDLEVRVGGELPPQMIAKRLASNYRVLAASPTYIDTHGMPKNLAALAEHKCIGIRERDQNHRVWRLESAAGIASVDLAASLMTNNGTVAKQWCLKGHGIMLRSIWDLQQDFLSGRLVRVLPEYHQSAEIHVIYASRLETSAKLRTCVAYLEEALPRFAGTGIS